MISSCVPPARKALADLGTEGLNKLLTRRVIVVSDGHDGGAYPAISRGLTVHQTPMVSLTCGNFAFPARALLDGIQG